MHRSAIPVAREDGKAVPQPSPRLYLVTIPGQRTTGPWALEAARKHLDLTIALGIHGADIVPCEATR